MTYMTARIGTLIEKIRNVTEKTSVIPSMGSSVVEAPSTKMNARLFSENETDAIFPPTTPVAERIIAFVKNRRRKLQTYMSAEGRPMLMIFPISLRRLKASFVK